MGKRATVPVILFLVVSALIFTSHAWASCTAPGNAIEAENCLTGTPQSTWDIGTPPSSGTGDSSIQGFGDNISVNVGGTINFKVNTNASAYRLDIYRMGYYQGNGARLVTTIQPSAKLPQSQPNCLTNASLGLYDCGNWAVSASWTVPTTAVSGIYFARLVRTDTNGASHIFFIVRNDASHSDILFQATDSSWQAYNDYGGQNFYGCGGWDLSCRSFKNSYNRPFHTRDFEQESVTWVFGNEYPMVRWLEANAYDVTYFTDTDTDRYGSLLLNHKLWMSNGHDEYWSGNQRANVEAARNAGVHLAFFSGNTMFWKTRWENSTDGTNTPYRTLVCYKETAGDVTDPLDPPTWTGTWRDPTKSPPADGGRPENAIKGNLFRMNGGQASTMQVPAADGKMRFWRNTTVATATGTTNLATGSVGAEFDDDEDNGFRPAGLFELTATSVTDGSNFLLDYGVTYGSGTAINKAVMYKYAPSGAIVFSTGTYRWSWGLDNHHDDTSLGNNTSLPMQQATVNLFADMGIQPVALQSGLTKATASTDTTPPASVITSPTNGSNIVSGSKITISGTATDVGGQVAGVEVSVDNGVTWHPATGRASWTYAWTASGNSTTTIRSRAVDDSGNLENPSAGVSVTVGAGSQTCPCTLFGTITPTTTDTGPDSPVELGVKFKSDVAGTVTGIRFYKSAANTGTHVGNLWNSTGTLMATATFTGETASGWQTVNFTSPVAIAANTYYVASYFSTIGHYSEDDNFFTASYDNAPLHSPQDGVSGANGAYTYSSSSAFPTSAWAAANYYVDLVFTPTATTSGVASVSVNPTSVIGGNNSVGTVTLTAPAPTAGLPITLSSDNAAATPNPASLTIPSGSSSGTFTVNTSVVTSSATAHISASDGKTNVQATLTVTPVPALASVTVNPTSVVGGNGTTGTVTLTYPAPAGLGITVLLSSDNAAATVPASATVAAGATTATFAITTTPVSSATTANISGTYNSVTPPAAPLTINPLTLASVTFNPATVVGPNGSTGTVTMSGATTSAITVSLGSNSASASVPATVTVAANASSATFAVTTLAVATSTPVTITATYGSSNVPGTLTINPAALSAVSMNPTSVVGGNPSTGTVTLTGPAPTGGITVGLQSNNVAVTVPANVTVLANTSSITFQATTTAVTSSTPVTITASYGAASPTATLTVTPKALLAIDKTASKDSSTNSKTIATPAFTTSAANELLLAFIATDNSGSGTNTTVSGVAGGGLTWTMVKRTNTQRGTSEVWRALAPAVVTNATVTATLSVSTAASITVVTFTGADMTTGTGATGTGNSAKGAPTASLTTTRNGSWVFGVANDWDNATARTVPAGQAMVHQYLSSLGDTYWVQSTTAPTATAGTVVTINDTAPTGDRFNMSLVEVLPSQ